jgi:hypothetical protein
MSNLSLRTCLSALLAFACLAGPCFATPTVNKAFTGAAISYGTYSSTFPGSTTNDLYTVYVSTNYVESTFSVYLETSPDGNFWSPVTSTSMTLAKGYEGGVYQMSITAKAPYVRLWVLPSVEGTSLGAIYGWIVD